MAFRTNKWKQEPVIIVGSGIAGLLLAIELAEQRCRVVLVTKGRLEESNTAWAQGGLAAVTGLNAADSNQQHLADTIAAGDGLTDPEVAQRIIADGGRLVRRLAEHGVEFDPSSLALEGGHRLARVLHSADATGRAIIDALIRKTLKQEFVQVLEECFLKEIIVDGERACGVLASRARTGDTVISGRAVVLCTGGLGQVFARTTNPGTATGDGIATAYRAGAQLVDMEFVQFHPTALKLKDAPAFLISEAVRGAGGILIDAEGQRFVNRFHPRGELATRDIVSRAIFFNMKEKGSDQVWLDMRPIGKDKILSSFPNIVSRLRDLGIDPVAEPVPVSPAAHYFMGGIHADESGRTTLAGLYAIGECASTGLHGANRLASNSLLEGGVMALKLASVLGTTHFERVSPLAESEGITLNASVQRCMPTSVLNRFKNDLLFAAGLVRNEDGLLSFLNSYDSYSPYSVPRPVNSILNAPNLVSDMTLSSLFRANSVLHPVLNSVPDGARSPDAILNSVSKAVQGSLSSAEQARLTFDSVVQMRADREASNAVLLGLLIAQSALQRKESRGAHWREDFPQRDDAHYLSRLAIANGRSEWTPLTDPHHAAAIGSAQSFVF